jgi:hypothetical protein
LNKIFYIKNKLSLSALVTITAFLSACESKPPQSDQIDAVIVQDNPVKFVVTDTAQDKCFDNKGEIITCQDDAGVLSGQDAQFPSVKPDYTDNHNQTITDNNTGLIWQKRPTFKQYQHQEAIDYCQDLSLAEYSDWRLPEIKELFSISDFRGEIVDPRDLKKNTPYIDTTYFDFKYNRRMAYIGQYWSSTKYTRGPLHNTQNVEGAFGYNFADGHIKAYETGYVFGTQDKYIRAPGNYVRCVRGTENVYGVNDFISNNDGTVTDKATNLMWQQTDDGIRRSWQDALIYAKNTTLAGHSDWRLPNIKELQSIVKYQGEVGEWPAIDTRYFTLTGKNTTADPLYVWSNTTQGDFKYTAAYISFGKAFSKKNSTASTFYDWHGAGAQRSDPKSGIPADYIMASENASDLVMTKNYSLLVRDAK